MKIITLKQPAIVDDALRNPIEGSLTVPDEGAQRLMDANLLTDWPVDVPDDGAQGGEGEADGLDDLTLPDLGILVTKEGVPLNGATRKADIIAAIREHRTPTA